MSQFLKVKDDGDMGRANKITTPPELLVVVPYIADILSRLKQDQELYFTNLPEFKYAFECRTEDSKLLEVVIDHTGRHLPDNVRWYSCDGVKSFQVRGPAGGIVISMVCYLITC